MYETHGRFNYIHCHQYNSLPPPKHVFFNFTHSSIYIITLIARMCTRLMSVFNMFTQMMHSKCFLITLIALVCNRLMSVFIMFTQMMDIICLFITIFVLSVTDQNVLEKWIFFNHVLHLLVPSVTFMIQSFMLKCHYSQGFCSDGRMLDGISASVG